MFVILDTQAIHRDFHLANAATQRLLEEAPAHGMVVCLPEIVIQEMLDDFRDQLEGALQSFEKSRRDLSRLRQSDLPLEPPEDLGQEMSAYENRLRAILSEHSVQVLPIPKVDASALFPRQLAHRRPFKLDGKGLNDVLIWESIVELCVDSSRPIALITGNSKDFADPLDDLVLHTDLQDDLKDIGFPQFNAELHRSISALVEKRFAATHNEGAASGESQASEPQKVEGMEP